jgi:hypothetical protein
VNQIIARVAAARGAFQMALGFRKIILAHVEHTERGFGD